MKIPKKIGAALVVMAVVAGGLGIAQSAQAAPIVTGTITLGNTSGTVASDPFLTSLSTNQPCPVGYQVASLTSVVQGAINFNISLVRSTIASNPGNAYGEWGFGTLPISVDRVQAATNGYVSVFPLSNAGLADGNFELRVYCLASTQNITVSKPSSPYFTLTLNQSAGNWSVPVAPVAPVATTTALTASASGTSVALAATVKKSSDSTVATAAAGSIGFFEGATQVGATQPVALGLAGVVLTLVANGSHTYTAVFTPSDLVYATSTSGSAQVSVGALVAPGATAAVPVGITFSISAGSGGGVLQLTSHDSSVDLGTAVLGAGTLNASGTLHAVVDDARQAGSPDWSLTGIVGDFTAGAKTLSGKYLGWTPAVAVGSQGNAGLAVAPAPGSPAGLKTSSQLAYGSTSAADPQVVTTTVSALLQLKAPSNTAAGSYSGQLTLTLI